jgi:predicted ATPase
LGILTRSNKFPAQLPFLKPMKSTAPRFPEIAGYTITEPLYLGSRTAVYRAIQTEPQFPVVIKVLQRDYPTFGELVQFRNQYAIAKNLPIAGIIHPVSLESFGNSYALVMEDWGGISLEKYIQQQPLNLSDTLSIAIQLAEILHHLYQHRVIHKDIKPANILIHPETRQIKLIDFSIASLLPKEQQQLINPNILEGTLAYISPEQTGRMNRGIDYRADFYSLGVTVFELLTGELPFATDDPMELVHSHIARPVVFPEMSQQKIPEIVQAIILKLMSKNAEDRYQSALGLKYDLTRCLTQWKQTGLIAEFELGQKDICDRFIIPEKLYGREEEVQTVLDAFERVSEGASELMLVAGFSGIGKTAVVNEVHKPIVKQRGYFIKGKFDQFNRNIPFSAFVQALRDLIGQLLSESDEQLQTWKAQILKALGENAQVIVELIPELESIIGPQPPAAELSGSAAQNRFNLLLQRFIQVFTTAEHPLVIFVDDLQWADSASLNLLKLLLQDTGYLLVLGAYRDNEVSPVHPFILTVDEILKTGAIVNTITLPPLNELDLNQLVADTLNCELSLAKPLTNLVYQKTQGNPFFATQFLKALHDDKLISFDWDIQHWQCDIAQVNALALTDDVVEFMALQLQKLPRETQDMLKLAACIGAEFDLKTLVIVSEQSAEVAATALWKALREGLIIPTTRIYKFFTQSDTASVSHAEANPTYRFLHDRVQQAAYSLIPDSQKKATHLKIGALLQENYSEIEQEEKLFDIVGHFNIGIELIVQPEERETLAQLNLAAGRKAKSSTAYSSARNFVQTGLELLSAKCWQERYELTLNLHVAATELAYLTADFEEMDRIVDQVLQSARTPLDKVKVYEIQINALTAQNQLLEAIAVGSKALKQLGFEFDPEPDDAITNKALQTVAEQLHGKQIEELIDLPMATEPPVMAAIQLMATFTPAIIGNPRLIPLLAAKIVSLSLEFGNAPGSALGYISYGLVMTNFLGEIETGYRFGRLAINFIDRFNIKEFKPITLDLFGLFLQHRCEPLRSAIPTMQQTYVVGIETGDLLSASFGIGNYFDNNFFAGVTFGDWQPEMENYSVALATMKQDLALVCLKMKQQVAEHFIEIVPRPDLLIGTAYDEKQMLQKDQEDNGRIETSFLYIFKTILAYLFGNYTDVLEYINQANLNAMATVGMIHTPIFHFYAGLTYLKLFPTQPEVEQANTLALVETHQTTLIKWAHYAPMNHQHKVDLVEAEKCRILGKNYEAGDKYDRAIAGAKEHQFLNEEALANELAAKFYLDWGKEKVASGYMQEAYYCYSRWGAKAKVDDLETRYFHLLRPILQPAEKSVGTWNTLMTIASPTVYVNSSTHKSSSSTSINQAFDFAAILKASQALSSTIELDKLLHQLTQIILQNSGGDRCVLLLPNQTGEWLVRAIATLDNTQLCTEPLVNHPDVPVKLIQYVKNTQEIVVIDDLKTDLPVIDDYLRQHQPKSVLCLPLLNQGQIIGILYLKNQFTIGAFTRDRVEVLNFLCTQAAISLENARLYQQAQDYAQQLEQSQLQMIQSEKMASLGNLVAGVAHEINNPLGFLNGSINNGKDYVQDLLEYLETYHQQQPPTMEVEELAQEIDLEFLLEDLPKLLDSMRGATERIKGISTSLRTFSRADTDNQVTANLHEGIDSTLLILKYRLKASECRPGIEVTKDYGDIPLIECFPGQLNQVFMNILANAIDVFDEMAQTQSFKQLQANPQQITIRTGIESNQVYILIGDNGKGMNEEIKAKIFDHLFTTKEVGKGTGLGLAIARQIVVDKHGGSLDVFSSPGEGTEFCISLPMGSQSMSSLEIEPRL